MNRRLGRMVAGFVLVGMAASASAAFVAPTDAQLAAAAAAPKTELAALLRDASLDEAAGVVASVAERVLGLGLSAEMKAQRLTELVRKLLDIMPSERHLSLLKVIRRAIAGRPALTAAMRTAIERSGGASAQALLAAFDQPLQRGAEAPPPVLHPPPPDVEPEGDSPDPTPTPTPTPDPTPEPPPSDPYEGQTL